MSSQSDLKSLRRRMIEVCAASGEGHLPSSCSVLELIYALHTSVMLPPDRFLLSKGHASLALYAVLEHTGKIPKQWLDEFCQPGANLLGHSERDEAHGIESTTGSLGHGFPTSVGLAYGLRLAKSAGRVFCLVGDSEMEEGSCWEAAILASRFKLSNLTLIVDNNGNSPNGIDGTPYESSLALKLAAFGFEVYFCPGHQPGAITNILDGPIGMRPRAVIAQTVKGKGIAMCEADPKAWHHTCPTPTQRDAMLASL